MAIRSTIAYLVAIWGDAIGTTSRAGTVEHSAMKRMWVALMFWPVLIGACGNPQGPTSRPGPRPAEEIPTRLDVVCQEDGSTELINDRVKALPDGVHIQVDNRAGEFVSLNGTALDFSEGVTEQVARSEPGELKIACWPVSKHTGPEPEGIAIEIHDPENYWSPDELECAEGELITNSTIDYFADAQGPTGNPEDIARKTVAGIKTGDEIVTVGYPKAESREVAVDRDGKTIALLRYWPAQKGGWLLEGYSTCESSGISV
jgi:hypothetical protein